MKDEEDSDDDHGYGLPHPDLLSYHIRNAKHTIFGQKYYLGAETSGRRYEFTYNKDDFYDFLKGGSSYQDKAFTEELFIYEKRTFYGVLEEGGLFEFHKIQFNDGLNRTVPGRVYIKKMTLDPNGKQNIES